MPTLLGFSAYSTKNGGKYLQKINMATSILTIFLQGTKKQTLFTKKKEEAN